MYLDFSKLPFNANGDYEAPTLLLQTLDGTPVGTIPGVSNLKMKIKFVEQSEMEFDVPSVIDGVDNPIYNRVTGYKLIYTKNYGIYVTQKPQKTSDGIMEVKHVIAYSIEKLMEKKKFFLEEGVFKFCNITNVSDNNTIIGRILEVDPTWNIGYISPTVAAKYGAFEEYDKELLDFIQNNAMQKYRCVFVFDPYGTSEKPGKTINVYDADETLATLPIYLGFDNLLTETNIEELTDELTTAIRPYGADGLSIRDVNPAGDDWVYDLSGFIARGDLSGDLADAFTSWQKRVLNSKAYYSALTAARASMWSKYYTENAKLTELQGELDGLLAQQNVAIQGQDSNALSKLYTQIDNKRGEMARQNGVIAKTEADIDNIALEIDKIVNGDGTTPGLALHKAMTDKQYKALLPYIIQQDVANDTFVISEIATDMTSTSHTLNNTSISVSGAKIDRVSLTSGFNCTMYTIVGGSFTASNISADIIRGTLEVDSEGSFTMSLYVGTTIVGGSSADDGIITISGTISGSVASDITTKNNDGVITYEGTYVEITSPTGAYVNWYPFAHFRGKVQFHDEVIGVTATFG